MTWNLNMKGHSTITMKPAIMDFHKPTFTWEICIKS